MDKEQFLRAIKDVQEPLRRFLLVLCRGDVFKADDIAQDACVKAWVSFEKFRGASSFSTWIFRIAYNCWCDRRYDDKSGTVELSASDSSPDADRADRAFKYQDLYSAIDQLNPSEKAAILLYYMEDRDIKEISTIMGIPHGSVKSLLSRGRSKLRIKLQTQ